MATKLEFCKRGHDTRLPSSRNKDNGCKICKKERGSRPEVLAKNRENHAKYRKSDAGKKKIREKYERYKLSGGSKITNKRYRDSVKGKLSRQYYLSLDRSKKMRQGYDNKRQHSIKRIRWQIAKNIEEKEQKISILELQLKQLVEGLRND